MTTDTGFTIPELASRANSGGTGAPPAADWLAPLREAALARFEQLGLPTTKDEEWRFTNIAPLAQTRFVPAESPTLAAERVRALGLDIPVAARLVFVNGRYAPEHSSAEGLPGGALALPLSEAVRTHRELVEPHLARHADGDAFTALNTAMLGEGVFVHIPGGVSVDLPIMIQNNAAADDGPIATHPRVLIVAGPGAGATVVEDYAPLSEAVYLTNAVTEAVVGPDASVTHYLVERESRRAFNISTLAARQERGSDFRSHSALLGGRIVRNNVNPVLAGPGAHGLLNGLFLPGQEQLIDNHMRVVHESAHCQSRQFYKGIMGGNGRGVFGGRIVVVQDAQKTDAVQSNNNLLLSDEAWIDTKPQLEIYADDVKCTHGATIGQIDEDAVFYLRSRGMSEEAARALLIYAFAAEGLDRMELQPLRDLLRGLLLEVLPHGREIRETL